MTSIQTIEEQLKSEYGAIKGWIAAHVYTSVGIALAIGFLLGKI